MNLKNKSNNILFNSDNNILWKKDEKPCHAVEVNLLDKYTKIEQEVTPDIAIKALIEGKTIKSVKDGNTYIYNLNKLESTLFIKEFKEYKWYIVD